MSQNQKKYLFIRLDRIGDLVLTLPVDEANLGAEIHWWIPPGLSFVTEKAQPKRQALEVKSQFEMRRFFELLRYVRRQKYDSALIFNSPWWISVLLWLARVPLRAGVKSKWHSFLFLNRAIRQKRSRAEMSELEYNYRLVEKALGYKALQLPRQSLKLKVDPLLSQSVLNRFGLKEKQYSVVHPGMGGSALNWPIPYYAQLIQEKSKTETIVITGTKNDEPYLTPLRNELDSLAVDPKKTLWLDQKLTGSELIAVLAYAKNITAPSTGVLHLAASTGTPTLGLFSPVRVQQPKRWGPQGLRVATLMPNVDCPGVFNCLGPQCPHFNCMESITAPQAREALLKLEQHL